MRNVIHELRDDLIREAEADPAGGGWSDPVIDGLRPGHRDLRESLEHIATAGDLFVTPHQRALARQALGLTGASVVSRAGSSNEIDELELIEALASVL
jgi:hypothetical protein